MTTDPETSLGTLLGGSSRRRPFGVLFGQLVDLPLMGSWLARAGRSPMRLKAASTLVTRFHAWLLRHGRPTLRHSWVFAAGQPVLSLTTTGRRTGRPRTTAVACFRDGDDLVLAGMNLGMSKDPNWALNLEAIPEAVIELRGEVISVLAKRAAGSDAARLWRRWVHLQPSAEAFRELSGREVPLFILTRTPSDDSAR